MHGSNKIMKIIIIIKTKQKDNKKKRKKRNIKIIQKIVFSFRQH